MCRRRERQVSRRMAAVDSLSPRSRLDLSSRSGGSGATRYSQTAQQNLPPLPPPPPAKWVSRTVEETRAAEGNRGISDDKWTNLKAYRHAKGLCFVCGEKWSRDHQCKTSISLHVVQEMIECMQLPDASDGEISETDQPVSPGQQQQPHHLLSISAAAVSTTTVAPRTM